MIKQGNNSKCNCGSGKKFKKCCMGKQINMTIKCKDCGFMSSNHTCQVCKDIDKYIKLVESGTYDQEKVCTILATKYPSSQLKIKKIIEEKLRRSGMMTSQCKKCMFCSTIIFNYDKFYVDTDTDEYCCVNCYDNNRDRDNCILS